MSGLHVFLAAVLISMSLAASVLYFLRKCFRTLLAHLCGHDALADFWLRLSSVLVILVATVAVMFHGVATGNPETISAALGDIVDRVRTSLLALIGSLITIGCALLFVITRAQRQ